MELNDLPEEILERIFSFTSQYTDYLNISQVCIKWKRIIDGLRILNKTTFFDCLENGRIYWKSFENKFSPAQRHSHSSCRVENDLYIFGGLSGTSTSYNDLWLFNLSQKTWCRPLCNGSFPSPKAAATLVSYDKKILLYGGYSHPYSYLHQQVAFFDEMHIFCTITSQWNQVHFFQEAPKLAGHTASILNNFKMIFFGGCNGSLGNKTNTVYCLDLIEYEWDMFSSKENSSEKRILREIDGPKPDCRYGHSQITLDDTRVLIIGGCGGPNKQYDDLWILHWPKDPKKTAHWQQIIVENTINSPSQIYCISFVRYDQKLVTFGKPRIPPSALLLKLTSSKPAEIGNGKNKPNIWNPFIGGDNDQNVYTKAGNLKTPQLRKCTCASLTMPILNSKNLNHLLPSTSENNSNATNSSSLNNIQSTPLSSNTDTQLLNKSQRNTIKRLEALQKFESKFDQNKNTIQQQLETTNTLTKSKNQCIVHSKVMQMFVLDIKDLFSEELVDEKNKPTVNWNTPIVEFPCAPLDTILYTLNKGIDEIILFGGMEMESASASIQKNYENVKHRVSSRLYIMKPDSLYISSLTSI